jgi:ssRNA-specific RNase YbeY (16S rRNA maturation enzyme)
VVTFNYLIKTGKPRDINKLKKVVSSLFEQEKTPLTCINYVFCTDEYLLSINIKYLSHNYFTDIITFRLSGKNDPVTADVFISTERVKFHGALHLCGYNDKTIQQKKIMRARENEYLMHY